MISKASFTLGLQTKKPLAQFKLSSLILVISKNIRVGEISVSKMFYLFKTGQKFGHLF